MNQSMYFSLWYSLLKTYFIQLSTIRIEIDNHCDSYKIAVQPTDKSDIF